MKKIGLQDLVFVAILAMFTFAVAGCSGLQARGAMSAAIDSNAAYAAQNQPAAIVGSIPAIQADAELAKNAVIFQSYADAATVNWFAYAFGNKTIYVNATYADLLNRTAMLGKATTQSAASQPVATKNALLVREYTTMQRISNAKAGKDGQ